MKKGELKNPAAAAFALLFLLSACGQAPSAQMPPSTPAAIETPAPTPAPTPEPTPIPEPVSLPPLPVEDYEPYHIEEFGATLLLPKSWAGNYDVDVTTWEKQVTLHMCVKDYPAGELGEPSAGNVSVFRVVSMPTEKFEETHLEGMTTQEWRDGLTQGNDVHGMWNWLGQKDSMTYATWDNTSFQAAVIDEEKYALFQKMSADSEMYPADASAYFIFDTQ